jgi:hypothetical protein
MGSTKRLLLIALIAFAAAAAGVFAARTFMDAPRKSESEVHALLHDRLKLDAAQAAKIEALEMQHATRKQALELEMRAANARLAEAIEAEHGYGPKVTEAVDHVHHVMGEMQKEVLEHLFAMRAVLNPQQASIFDRTVVKALTAEAHPSSER